MSIAQEFHTEDINLLLEGASKHFLWQSEYPLLEKDLKLKAYISTAVKKPTLPINNEVHSVLQNWDNIIAFMMCRMHLYREVHAAGDL